MTRIVRAWRLCEGWARQTCNCENQQRVGDCILHAFRSACDVL